MRLFKSRALSMNASVRPSMGWLAAFVGAGFLSISIAQARDFGPAREGHPNEIPRQLIDVGIEQKLGEKIDLDLKFVDHTGRDVTLRDYTKNGKPILLSLAYFNCPSLCNFHLNGLNDAFKQMKQPLGQEFNMVVVSFDPREKTDLAAAKRASYVNAYGRHQGADGWHFLTGTGEASAALAKAVGFSYRWDEEQKQYAHAAAAYAIAPSPAT